MSWAAVPNPEIVVEIMRCFECGRWWGVEKGNRGQCPRCAADAISRANDRADAAERSARALRGAVTRLAKARRAAR